MGGKDKAPMVPCPAGCGYMVLSVHVGQPHNILVGGNWITCPGR